MPDPILPPASLPDDPDIAEQRCADQLQKEEMIDWLVGQLGQGWQSKAIAGFKERYGSSTSTAYKYLGYARERILELARPRREEAVAKYINVLESIIYKPKARDSDRIRAIERACKILGYDAPTQTQLTGADGRPLQLQAENTNLNVQAPTDAHQLAEVLHILRQAGVLDTSDTAPPDPSPPERTA